MKTSIIVFGNQKGGVGKTTLSVGVAGAWAEAGYKVLFVDADPQRSPSEQLSNHPAIEYVKHTGGDLDTLLPEIEGDFHIVIIDTPSGVSEALTSALSVASLLIIPVKPSPYDFFSAETTVDIAKAKGVRAAFVINEVDARMRFAKQAADAVREYGLPVLTQHIMDRAAHRETVAMGKVITDANLNGGKAADEVRGLAAEILKILESGK